MKKYKIKLIDVGRDNFNYEYVKEFNSLREAESFAYKEADKQLMSSDTSLERNVKLKCYIVYAGFRNVGVVTIEVIK